MQETLYSTTPWVRLEKGELGARASTRYAKLIRIYYGLTRSRLGSKTLISSAVIDLFDLANMTTKRVKLHIIGTCLLFLIIFPITEIRAGSEISISVFARFKEGILAQYISETGSIPFAQELVSGSPLLEVTNNIVHNFVSALIAAIVSDVTGLPVEDVYFLPLFTPIFILAQALVVTRLLQEPAAFPIAVLFSVSFQYLQPVYISGIHRGYLAWTLFFVLLLYLLVSKDDTFYRSSIGILVLIPIFVSSAHTLPAATLVFFFVLSALKNINGDRETFVWIVPVLFISVVTYYALIFKWLGDAAIQFIIFSSYLVESGDISPGLISGSIGLHSSIPVASISQPALYKIFYALANLIAFGLAVTSVIIRGKYALSVKNIEFLDMFLIAIVFQGIANIALQSVFPSSGGINPLFLGLFFTPLFGCIVVLHVSAYIDINLESAQSASSYVRPLLVVLMVILLILPAFTIQIWQPNTPRGELTTISEENEQQIEWVQQYSQGDVTSSFNVLSAYFFKGGRKGYIPRPGNPPYSTDQTAKRFVEVYYNDPVAASSSADTYIVTKQMKHVGIFNIGSFITKPNPELSYSLSKSSKWSKVHSVGSSETFVET